METQDILVEREKPTYTHTDRQLKKEKKQTSKHRQ